MLCYHLITPTWCWQFDVIHFKRGRKVGRVGGAGGVGLAAFKQVFPLPKKSGKQTPCPKGKGPKNWEASWVQNEKISEKFFLEVKILNITIGKGSVWFVFQNVAFSTRGKERQSNLSKICLNLYISSQKMGILCSRFSFFMQPRPPGLFLADTKQNHYHCQEIVPLKNCFWSPLSHLYAIWPIKL